MSSSKRVALFVFLAILGSIVVPQGASALSFAPSAASPITVPSPNDQVTSAATADLDGNGNDDIVSVGGTMGIHVFLANNEGTGFTQAAGSPFGTNSTGFGRLSVFTGQFGGDSATDVLTMDYNFPRTFQTFLGNGDGTISSSADFTYTVPDSDPYYPSVVSSGTVGDVNGDGWPDIVAGMTRRAAMVALGSSTGQFTTAPGSPLLVPTDAVNRSGSFTTQAIGDFNGDGDPDIALGLDDGNNNPPGLYVAEGDGTGAFTASGTPVLARTGVAWPSSLSAIDLNGDEYEDLAIATSNLDNVETLLGSPAGLVTNPSPDGTIALTGGYPFALTIADLDNDGLQDIAVGNRQSRNVAVLRNLGDGGLALTAGSPFALPPINGKNFAVNNITSGDFNGDGAQDLAGTSTHSSDPNQARGIDVLISQPQVDVSPTTLDFPTTRLNQTSAEQSVTVKNTGAPSLDLQSIDLSGTDPDQFDFDRDDCPTVLAAGDECTIGVTFTPTSYPTPTANLDVDIPGLGNTSIALTGHTPPYMDFVPPNGLVFGEVTSGYAPAAKTETVVIYSGGGAPLELGAPSIDGPDAADFSIENPNACADPIAFGDHCALDITFAPPADTGGFREAYLTFASNNDPEFDEEIPLTGYGIRAEFTVDPASFDFGEAKIGPTIERTAKTFTLTSTGPADVPFAGLQMTGPNADSFLITANNCPATIDAYDGTCSFSVVFDPKYGSASARNATLEVDAFSSVKSGKTLIPLSGTATSDPIPPPPVKDPKLTLNLKSAGKVKRGKTLVVTATIKNVGEGAATPVTIKTTVPKKFAKAPKAIQIPTLEPGSSITRKLKIKVKRTAKKGKKLAVKVTASSGAIKQTATRTVKIR